jgi:hypothetical protein
MSDSASERARTLELIIRAAAAEERLLGRRLERIAQDQRKTRDEIARELRHEHFGQPPATNGQTPATNGRPPAQDGNSER